MDEGQLDLQGNRIHYRQRNGPGGNVVFVHGWASSSRMWARELEALGSRYRCLALDLPGHGKSSNPPYQWYSLANFASVTHEFVQMLHARQMCLVGHSLGGTIAMEVALRYPHEVRGLVLVSPVITGRLSFNLERLVLRGPRQIILNLTRRIWPRLAAGLQQALALDILQQVPQEHMRRNLEDLTQATADSLLGSAEAAGSDISPRLGEVRAPTLVIIGHRDRTVPPEEGRLAARRIPGARLVDLPTGHNPGDEAPEAFLKALREFLDQTMTV
jgi:pimeloyl-ACP methyl ester carboxylesterase